MGQKILFLDIDGTLVNFKGKIADSAKKAVMNAKINGHKLVICTGRSRFQIYGELIELGFDGIVGGAGAYVISDGKEIYHNYLDMEKRKPLFDYLEQNKFAYGVQCDCGMVINQRSMTVMQEVFKKFDISEKQMGYMFGKVMIQEDVWNYPREEKVIYHRAPFPVEKVKADLKPDFDVTPFSLNEDNGDAGEIGMAGINKATGMQIYLDYIGAKQADTIAFGDGPNDMEMIEFAGIGVAMGNAHQNLKEIADMVTDSIEEDGILHAMEKLELI